MITSFKINSINKEIKKITIIKFKINYSKINETKKTLTHRETCKFQSQLQLAYDITRIDTFLNLEAWLKEVKQ